MAEADWAQVYRDHGPRILRYLRRLAKDDETAADLLQETFVRALRARSIPADPQQSLNWLYRVAANLAIDHLRRERRHRWFPLGGEEAQEAPAGNGESELVRAALRSIPPDQAVALLLRVQEERSRADIAELLGVSESAVKSRISRGRANFAAAYRRLERGLRR